MLQKIFIAELLETKYEKLARFIAIVFDCVGVTAIAKLTAMAFHTSKMMVELISKMIGLSKYLLEMIAIRLL